MHLHFQMFALMIVRRRTVGRVVTFAGESTTGNDNQINNSKGHTSFFCREATLRLAYVPGANREFNFEIKSVDGTANPYLAVSAIIVAGLDGIRKNVQLTLKELTVAPSELETKDRLELKKIPSSIEDALSILEEPTEYGMYCNGMGKTLVDIFVAVRKGETEFMRKMSKEDQLKFVIRTY